MSEKELSKRIEKKEEEEIMKIGKNIEKVREVMGDIGIMGREIYVEREKMENKSIVKLEEVNGRDWKYL